MKELYREIFMEIFKRIIFIILTIALLFGCMLTRPVDSCLYHNGNLAIEGCETPVYLLYAYPSEKKIGLFDLIRINNISSGTKIMWDAHGGALMEDVILEFENEKMEIYSIPIYEKAKELNIDSSNPAKEGVFDKKGFLRTELNWRYKIYDDYELLPSEVRKIIGDPKYDLERFKQ